MIDHRDWYILGGKLNPSETMEPWKTLRDESSSKGFNHLRVTGEMACFFENRTVNELVEYERSIHKAIELPMSTICACDSNVGYGA